ncbi:probasin-like [Nannospalax galili]|uniref:probasin-like n=1 Tax=Nannospalax galili TaxID=1026970 RepID=UPI00111BE77A|nr:probasin-like [Nannospalax galili]
MKLILLMVASALLCVSCRQNKDIMEKITGNWTTVYLASSAVDLIKEDGPLRTYFRHIGCNNKCKILNLSFYVKKGGKCKFFRIPGRKGDKNVYEASFEGKNRFMIKLVTKKMLLFYYYNEQNSNVGRVVGALARAKQLTEKQMEKYMDLVAEIGIEDENVQRVVDTDTCPP